MDRKQLKQPDALQRAGLEAGSWIEGKEKLIASGIALILLAGLGIGLASELGKRGSRRAEAALGAALEPVMRPLAEAGSPAEPKDGKIPFASQEEKDRATVESLAAFRSAHSGTRSAATAALPLGQAHYRLGQYDQALAAYQAFLDGVPQGDLLRAVALEGMGYAREEKGELDQALASFEELSRFETGGFLEGMGHLHRGRILILQGKMEEAARVLSEVPASYPNSAAARMAGERLNLLASQGVEVPTPAAPQADDGAGS